MGDLLRASKWGRPSTVQDGASMCNLGLALHGTAPTCPSHTSAHQPGARRTAAPIARLLPQLSTPAGSVLRPQGAGSSRDASRGQWPEAGGPRTTWHGRRAFRRARELSQTGIMKKDGGLLPLATRQRHTSPSVSPTWSKLVGGFAFQIILRGLSYSQDLSVGSWGRRSSVR